MRLKACRPLGYVRRKTRHQPRQKHLVRRSAYLTLVRSHLGYATQVCLDSAVNRPDSKARACPEVRYKVYWIYHSFVTKHI